MGKLTDKVAKGFFWTLMEKIGIQGVHFVVTLVLARLLTPNDYGTVALLSIFIAISDLLIDCGFGKALVQKKNVSQTDFNTAFYLSVSMAAILYSLLFLSAPAVASFYSIPGLCPMLRLLAISLVFRAVNGVQNAELHRKMLFKLSFRIGWSSASVKAVVGVVMAYMGYGAWALVWASLAGGFAGVVARQLVIHWRPALIFSWQSARELFGFGWKTTAASLLTKMYNELYGLLIGKFYTRADLAFVRKGAHIPKILRELSGGMVGNVSFPALTRFQDDPARMLSAMRKVIRCSTFALIPTMTVLAIVAEPVIRLMYGERWLPCVPFLRIACLGCAFSPVTTANTQALMACGKTGVYLATMMVYRALGLAVMVIGLRYGVFEFYLANILFSTLVGMVIWAYPNRRNLGYSLRSQICDLVPTLCLTLAAAAVATAVMAIPVAQAFLFIPAAAAGLFSFMGLALLSRNRILGEIATAIEPTLRRKLPFTAGLVAFAKARCSEVRQ